MRSKFVCEGFRIKESLVWISEWLAGGGIREGIICRGCVRVSGVECRCFQDIPRKLGQRRGVEYFRLSLT